MSKRIAFCADGTWDTAKSHTNVYKLYKSLTVSADQMPFYDDGVGATGLVLKSCWAARSEPAFGKKLSKAIRRLRKCTSRTTKSLSLVQPRRIYGAEPWRALLPLAVCQPRISRMIWSKIAFDAYRDRPNRAEKLKKLANCNMYKGKIKMIGVWDTVGSREYRLRSAKLTQSCMAF